MKHRIRSTAKLLVPRFRCKLFEPSSTTQRTAMSCFVVLSALWLGALLCAIFQFAALCRVRLYPGVKLTVPPMSGDQYLSLYNTTNSTNNDAIRHTLVDKMGIGLHDRPEYDIRYNSHWYEDVSNKSRLRFDWENPILGYYLMDLVVLQDFTWKETCAIQREVMTPYIRSSKNKEIIARPSLYFADIKEQQIKTFGFLAVAYMTLSLHCLFVLFLMFPLLCVPWHALDRAQGPRSDAPHISRSSYLYGFLLLVAHPLLATGFFVNRSQVNARGIDIINSSALNKEFAIVASKIPFSPWLMHLSLITFEILVAAALLTGIAFYYLGLRQKNSLTKSSDNGDQALGPVKPARPAPGPGLSDPQWSHNEYNNPVSWKSSDWPYTGIPSSGDFEYDRQKGFVDLMKKYSIFRLLNGIF